MEFLKIFIKNEVPAVGLTKFREQKEEKNYNVPQRLNLNRRTIKANYNNNFFLL